MSQYGYLMHHGVKGMRWGVRNYQNPDGSLTAEGKARYGTVEKYNKAMATRQKIGKVAKGIGIASAASLAAGAAIGGGIVAYQNRDKIASKMATNRANKNMSLVMQRNAAQKAGNLVKAAKLNSKISSASNKSNWLARNQDKLITSGALNNGRIARDYRKAAARQGYVKGAKMLNSAKDWNKKGKDFNESVSKIEKGLKIIGAGTAAIGVVTSGIAAVKGIANTASNLYVTKDLPVVKEGARILNEKGYLSEDHPIYKWIIEKK